MPNRLPTRAIYHAAIEVHISISTEDVTVINRLYRADFKKG